METVHGKYEQKSLVTVANTQTRVPVKMELANPAKKILTTTAKCFVTGVERKDADIRVNGKTVTQVIFIDEFGAYNSEERADEFSERFTPKNAETIQIVSPMAVIIQTVAPKLQKGETDLIAGLSTEHVINIALTGLKGNEISYVRELSGDVESVGTQTSVASWGATFFEKFDIGETLTLDSNVEGILCTDLSVHIRDINVANERFTIKGVASVNASVVRNVEGAQSVATAQYDFDFAKSFNKKDVTDRDIICGNVLVSNVGIKVESLAHPSLTVEAELIFTGHSIVRHEINMIKDAFSCDNNLDFTHTTVNDVAITGSQQNIVADVEGNVSMPEGSPFIGKVLLASMPIIGSINVKPTDDKTIVEGVLTTNIIYECEEHHVYSHVAEVPFAVTCKIDNCTAKHNINVALTPLSCNVKARRGKELLVDARLGANVVASSNNSVKVASNVQIGKARPAEDHAITIHIADAKETLWDIAKRASIPTAEVIRQNPSVANGINEGDRIVMYRRARAISQ
ncbi:MAG: DUF3794 domain-containing protein [Christensenellaceae bacterium]|jgi:hypothetical protein|nr:DUF3794 domain-containing protein [Christensenellaceae bacterium]